MTRFGAVDNMGVRSKFVLLLLVPLVTVTVFGATQAGDKYGTLVQMHRVQDLTGLNRELSGLVHDLQKERGRTSLFLAAGGKQFATVLTAQRLLTDGQLATLNAILGRFDSATYGSAFGAGRDAAVPRLV
jgi:methyl-accepting chemotaxis protein